MRGRREDIKERKVGALYSERVSVGECHSLRIGEFAPSVKEVAGGE